jgi:hypothetical protein
MDWDEKARGLAEIIESHTPLESCAGEPGDAGCSCGEAFSEYTWKGYCVHLAGKLSGALAACALEEAKWWAQQHLLTHATYRPLDPDGVMEARKHIAALERAAQAKLTDSPGAS